MCPIFMCAYAGIYLASSSSIESNPCSSAISAATAVMGLVMDARRNMASSRKGCLVVAFW